MQPATLPFFIVLLISIIQTFIILIFGFQLFNLNISGSKTLLVSFIAGVATFFIRKLPLLFGIHTLILIVFAALLVFAFTNNKVWHCFIAVTAGALVLGILEGALLPILLKATANTLDSLVLKPWLNILYSAPSVIVMFIFYFLIRKCNFILFDLSLSED